MERQRQGPAQRRDAVEFCVYSPAWSSAAALEAARARCDAHGRDVVGAHVWNFGTWSVGADAASARHPARLRGRVAVGDCVGDEWLVASAVFAFTRLCAGSAATLRDVDGEFLLIEAALHLPDWVDPSTSHNRAWIIDGVLHIVPPSAAPLPASGAELSVGAALDVLRRRGGPATRCTAALQRTIAQRIDDAAAWSRSNVHRARCVLPSRVAALLRRTGAASGDVAGSSVAAGHPSILAAAVDVFFSRTPRDLSAAGRMVHVRGGGEGGTSGVETVVVSMSRTMFAKLRQQQFVAPRTYAGMFAPPPAAGAARDSAARKRKRAAAHSLGVKLACAVEMAAARGAEEKEGEAAEDDDGLLATCARVAVLLRDGSSGSGTESDSERGVASDDEAWLDVGAAELDALLRERGLTPEEILAGEGEGDADEEDDGTVVLDDDASAARFGGALAPDSDDDLPMPAVRGEGSGLGGGGGGAATASAGVALTRLTDGLRAFMASESNLLDGVDVRGMEESVDSDDDLPTPSSPRAGEGLGDDDRSMAQLMAAMDAELRQRDAAGGSGGGMSERAQRSLGRAAVDEGGDEALLEALLASHAEGLASGVVGPLAGLAAELGIALPTAGR